VAGIEVADRLQFQYHLSFDEQIRLEIADKLATEKNRNPYVRLDHQPDLPQRDNHCFPINALQKAMPQFVVNVVENTNDFLSQLLVKELG